MIGSELASEIVSAHGGNYTLGRQGNRIRKVTLHHMAARWTARRCGESFQAAGRQGSSHYGIGFDGEIAQYVSEEDTAWADGNWDSNLESVSIECANSSMGGDWPVSDATLHSLARLLADISRRNGLGKYVKGRNLTWHKMYAATACPGPFLLSRLDQVLSMANAELEKQSQGETVPVKAYYQVHAGAWLPTVSGNDVNDQENGFAGILGTPIDAALANLSYGNLYYKCHVKGGGWLPEVKNREDYAGILGSPVDAIMIRSDSTAVHYRVHTREDGWLPAVSGYDASDSEEGYAGVLGHAVDGLIIWADSIEKKPQTPPPVTELESVPPMPQEPGAEEPKGEEKEDCIPPATPSLWERVLSLMERILDRILSFLED